MRESYNKYYCIFVTAPTRVRFQLFQLPAAGKMQANTLFSENLTNIKSRYSAHHLRLNNSDKVPTGSKSLSEKRVYIKTQYSIKPVINTLASY